MILNPYIFKKEPNTFIGNAGATLSTKALLAVRLGFAMPGQNREAFITNFNIDANNNISCHISRSYLLQNNAFRNSNTPGITYFIDLDGKCSRPSNAPSDGNEDLFRGNTNFVAILPKFNQLSYTIFAQGSYDLISIPSHIPIGFDTADNSVFIFSSFTGNVYVNIANETNNGGNPDADIKGAVVPWIKYSSNSQSPSNPENITVTGKDSNSIQIEWDAISHTNAIDWYLVFANGVYKGKTASTDFDITGLTGSTDYEIKILAIDEMGNNSKFSESIVETTDVTPFVNTITDLSVAANTDTTATLTFTLPDSSSAIAFFRVYVDGVLWEETADDTIPITITGLTSGTDYDVYVNAVDVNGLEGGDGNEVSFETFVQEMQDVIDYAISESIAIPNHTKRVALNNLIKDAIDTGIWAKMDVFTNFAWNDISLDDFSLIDYKRLSLMTVHGGMTYTVNGWEGNGVDGYINPLFNPSIDGVNYTLNDASFGGVVYKQRVTGNTIIGQESSAINLMNNLSSTTQRINRAAALTSEIDLSGDGMLLLNREDSTTISGIQKSNYQQRTGQSAANSLTNINFNILRYLSTTYSDAGFSNSFFGGAISNTIAQDFRTAYNTYLTSIGLSAIS